MPDENVTQPKAAHSSAPGKDGKVFKTFRLKPSTVAELEQVGKAAGLPPSAVVEVLLSELTKHGAHRIDWTAHRLAWHRERESRA